jgi:hypothetical protein
LISADLGIDFLNVLVDAEFPQKAISEPEQKV